MKQHITKEQFKELNYRQYREFRNKINIRVVSMDKWFCEYITIGKMIEFLGDDLKKIIKVDIGFRGKFWNVVSMRVFRGNEDSPCDALWEEIKYKLKT